MKVILCENVVHLGDMGSVVNVSPGYARNFLFPRNLAVSADSGTAKQLEHTMREIRKREEKHKVVLRDVASQIEALNIEIEARAGAEGKLFGSVTSMQIAERLRGLGHELDRRQIVLHDPIKSVGVHKVQVKLGNGVEATLKVNVKAIAEEVPAAEEEAEAEAPAEAPETAETGDETKDTE